MPSPVLAPATAPPSGEHLASYALRVLRRGGRRRFLLHDLHTGERREFADARALVSWLARRVALR